MIDIIKYKNPLLVAGHAIRISNAIEEFHELMDKLNISVVTTFNGFDIVANDHPNYVGRIGTLGTSEGNKALREADLVICLGTRNNIRQISYKWKNFAKNAERIVLVDIDWEELKKETVVPHGPSISSSPDNIGYRWGSYQIVEIDVKDFIEEWLGRKTISWSNA